MLGGASILSKRQVRRPDATSNNPPPVSQPEAGKQSSADGGRCRSGLNFTILTTFNTDILELWRSRLTNDFYCILSSDCLESHFIRFREVFLDFVILIATTVFAGFVGSILGLGGGIIMVPVLVIVFDFPIISAVGTSLVAIVITSAAASSVYLKRGIVSLPMAFRLELYTVLGATMGGLSAPYLPARLVAISFGVVLLWTAYQMAKRSFSKTKGLSAAKNDNRKEWGFEQVNKNSRGKGYISGISAGLVSAILGVGGGVIKVPIMHLLLGAPIKKSTATSAFMIGITASAGAVHYLGGGYVNPMAAIIVAGSVFIGARIGAVIAPKIKSDYINLAFSLILVYSAIRMFLKG
ncbi:MAG: TSUP family transporter [candidate division Zixibacteria bacterium]|nr:TSUP family transporter [candidate division Zixibacteria bacterium]